MKRPVAQTARLSSFLAASAALAAALGLQTIWTNSNLVAQSSPAQMERVDRHPERRGIGALPTDLPPRPPGAVALVAVPTLVVNEPVVLEAFSFKRVMETLAAQASGGTTTALTLYRQWWDSQAKDPGVLAKGPHCDDAAQSFLTYAYRCGRPEEVLAADDPFGGATDEDDYVSLALFNRFDLAPTNGEDCGEYRVVFARKSGVTNPLRRNLIIFEAVLPNPTPLIGLKGCRPILDFWASLGPMTPTARRTALENFYFSGLPGFRPVVHLENYGDTSVRPSGQIRTNQFMGFPWTLREFKLRRECRGVKCDVRAIPVTVKTNPAAVLFSSPSAHALAPEFQRRFVDDAVVANGLAKNDVNLFSYSVRDLFNTGDSDENGTVNDYVAAFNPAGTFATEIAAKLKTIGSGLTATDVVRRSQALSCAGCHELTKGAQGNLGGGVMWPTKSQSFTHVDENRTLSEALTTVFLPHRLRVFEACRAGLNGC